MTTRARRIRSHLLRRAYLYAPLLAATVGLSAWLGPILIGDNFREVLPGRVYRSRQPSADELRTWQSRYGIRTVINLRGAQGWRDRHWHVEEVQACRELGLRLVEPKMSASKLPAPPDLRKLLDALADETSYPLLIHCRNGADRSGLAAAAALILAGRGVDEAVNAGLRWEYGHVPDLSGNHAMGEFFELYRRHLREKDLSHSRAVFLEWGRNHYVPYGYRAWFEVLSSPGAVAVGEPIPVKLRVTNTSHDDWRFSPDIGEGLVLWSQMFTAVPPPRPEYTFPVDHAQTVRPGESIQFDVKVRPFTTAGRYGFKFDLCRPATEDIFERYGSNGAYLEVNVVGSDAGEGK